EECRRKSNAEQMNDVGKRLCQNRLLTRQRVRNSVELRFRQRHVLGEASRSGTEAKPLRRLPKALRSREAPCAASPPEQRIGTYATPVTKAAKQFMAEHERRFSQCAVAEKSRDVGATNSSKFDRYFFFARL